MKTDLSRAAAEALEDVGERRRPECVRAVDPRRIALGEQRTRK